ncbi:hypothetical protein SUGI_0837550 [Cryptomeria japonica]|nr:hypothetical protein SUGI_0837550 [Cryptomeria japonica]
MHNYPHYGLPFLRLEWRINIYRASTKRTPFSSHGLKMPRDGVCLLQVHVPKRCEGRLVWCIFTRTLGSLQLLLLKASSMFASVVFGDNPPIRQDVLANAFNFNDQQIKELIS